MDNRALRVGLTGGIASGKSTVADMFAALGVEVIDTDLLAREVVMPGQPALREISDAFGPQVLQADGTLDRRAMRELVFRDAAKKAQLEALLHPRIRDLVVERATCASGPYVVIVVPLMVESPIREFMDRILVVDCSEDMQLERLLARDAESEEQGRRIMATQASREERLAIADDVIVNDGALADTEAAVQALHERYLALAGAR